VHRAVQPSHHPEPPRSPHPERHRSRPGGRFARLDNDCSFLSGWGLALWRSSRNIISRNAFDFCVRGTSRASTTAARIRPASFASSSATTTCSPRTPLRTAATASSDSPGRDALGELWLERQRERPVEKTSRQDVDALIRVTPDLARDFSERGCNRNVLLGNDFSYAPAHGIELTFSEHNVFARNRLVENAIAVSGGYASDRSSRRISSKAMAAWPTASNAGRHHMEHASDNRILGTPSGTTSAPSISGGQRCSLLNPGRKRQRPWRERQRHRPKHVRPRSATPFQNQRATTS